MARRKFVAVIAAISIFAILAALLTGCNKEKTPDEEFSRAKEDVIAISTQNFYCFKEFVKNVILKEEGIDVEDLFVKIDYDNTITVHVLSSAKTYTVYTVESKQQMGLVRAIPSEQDYIYLESHDDYGEEILLQRPFNESIWNSWYDVESDRIIIEP